MEKQSSSRSRLRRAYDSLCAGELYLAAALFILIVVLVFISALTRKIGLPIQWTMDVTKLCFAWLAFLSGDIALRLGVLPGIDMFVIKLPPKVRIVLAYLVKVFMFTLLVFFCLLRVQACILQCEENVPNIAYQLFICNNEPSGLLGTDDVLFDIQYSRRFQKEIR
ncbi:MAG: TRAP transporter small permease subunit [bacterium]|nr:TRAP transporter small permease subunit [bacterium]